MNRWPELDRGTSAFLFGVLARAVFGNSRHGWQGIGGIAFS